MKKSVQKLLLAVIAVVFSLCASAAKYAPVSYVLAEEAQLEQFPIEAKPLSAARQAALGLRPYALQNDVLFQDHQRGGKFALKLLKAGTLVLVDKDGVPRYEEKCGNRLIDPRSLSPAKSEPVTATFAALPYVKDPLLSDNPSAMDTARSWVNKLPEPAKLAIQGLSWLATLALLIAAAVLVFWGLSAMIGSVRHDINANNWHRPTPLG